MPHPSPSTSASPVTALLAPLGPGVVERLERAVRPVARALCSASEAGPRGDDLAVIDEELAQLLAARELFKAWVERTQTQDESPLTPAQFLRAWGESTGRVIQLLKARRELGGGSQTDALLDAVYAELEAELLRGWAPEQPQGEALP